MSLVKDGYAYEVWNKRDVLHHSPVNLVKRKNFKKKKCFFSRLLGFFNFWTHLLIVAAGVHIFHYYFLSEGPRNLFGFQVASSLENISLG